MFNDRRVFVDTRIDLQTGIGKRRTRFQLGTKLKLSNKRVAQITPNGMLLLEVRSNGHTIP